MFYREYAPHPLLQPYVKCFWALEHDYSFGPHQEEWLPANAQVEMIFHYGHRYEHHSAGGSERQSHCFVMGQQEQHTVFRSAGLTGLIALRFQPWGAFPFFRLPVSELSNQLLPLESVGGRSTVELEEQLLGLSRNAALRLLEKVCLDRIRDFNDELQSIRAIASRIILTGGQIRISELLETHGLSQRQLERKFQTYVGMSPKRLARLIRFQSALHRIRADPRRELTSIAYACGYSDQSHFIKEFHEIFGKTPSEVRAEALIGMPSDYDVEFLQSD